MSPGGDGAVGGDQILAQDDIRCQRLMGVHQNGQFLVLDLDRLDAIGRRIAVFRDDKGNLLPLEQHFSIGQHHLLVARKGRHPVQAQGAQIIGRQHRQHTGHLQGRFLIDALDARMGIGRADEIAKQHPVELDVVDIFALALGKARVLDALARTAQALEIVDAIFACEFVLHSAASLAALISAAAAWIALMMF
jgi:hypothetical protein